jgi:TRAP-type C4-dicarboxylate transport system substrate-binding protein
MLDGVTAGSADIGNFAMSYQPGRFPVSEAVDLYHGFTSATVASQVLFDLVDKYKPKEFEKVKIITLFTCPPTNFMTSKPVTSLKDLKGTELRVAGTSSDVLKRLGGVAGGDAAIRNTGSDPGGRGQRDDLFPRNPQGL